MTVSRAHNTVLCIEHSSVGISGNIQVRRGEDRARARIKGSRIISTYFNFFLNLENFHLLFMHITSFTLANKPKKSLLYLRLDL